MYARKDLGCRVSGIVIPLFCLFAYLCVCARARTRACKPEVCGSVKRDLFIWQKRPTNTSIPEEWTRGHWPHHPRADQARQYTGRKRRQIHHTCPFENGASAKRLSSARAPSLPSLPPPMTPLPPPPPHPPPPPPPHPPPPPLPPPNRPSVQRFLRLGLGWVRAGARVLVVRLQAPHRRSRPLLHTPLIELPFIPIQPDSTSARHQSRPSYPSPQPGRYRAGQSLAH